MPAYKTYRTHPAFLALFWLVMACTTPAYLDKEALQNYVQDVDHGVSITKEWNDVKISVINRPTGLLLAQELDAGKEISYESLQKLQEKYGHHYYFVIGFSRGNKELLYNTGASYDAFSQQLQTLAFRMPDYLTMTTSTADTIPVADFAFPRTYGMGGSTQLMVVFDKNKAKGKKWVQVNLNEFGFGLGNQRFRFNVKDLEKVPELKIENS
ncbi:hypothetical protein FNH22_23175 [Fulvivirga sp. M361]|uniref:hypothetical protein n=1 Tax=Fulvivirga sp. M361 TaxID=2594266 RepID=UPI001179E616|nr:hypothetical protein [Fulvivirga sp. M361]TRX51859.1 hypothetical protein FNH22_23175 [Fulvivirga sp. M361]